MTDQETLVELRERLVRIEADMAKVWKESESEDRLLGGRALGMARAIGEVDKLLEEISNGR